LGREVPVAEWPGGVDSFVRSEQPGIAGHYMGWAGARTASDPTRLVDFQEMAAAADRFLMQHVPEERIALQGAQAALLGQRPTLT